MSLVRLLPAWLHVVADYAVGAALNLAALLLVSLFALNFRQSDGGLSALHFVAGITVLAVSLITNCQYRPQAVAATIPTGGRSRIDPAA